MISVSGGLSIDDDRELSWVWDAEHIQINEVHSHTWNFSQIVSMTVNTSTNNNLRTILNMASQGNGQHVLLTGANGFVASHILSILLEVQMPFPKSYQKNN